MHVEKNSWKLITICFPKSCSLKICCSRKSPYGGGGVVVKDLIPQCGSEEFKSPQLQPRLPWLFR